PHTLSPSFPSRRSSDLCLDARDACSCCSRFVEYGGFSGRNAPPARGTSTDAILLFETGANKNFSTKLAIQPTKLRQPTCGKPWADRKSTRLNSSHVKIS